MKTLAKLSILPCLLFMSSQIWSQVSFTNQNVLLNGGDHFSGVAMSVTDVNGDNLDDIVRLNQGHVLNVQYQTPGGGPFTEYVFGSIDNNSQWMLAAADCNNNGFADFMAGDAGSSQYFLSDATGQTYTAFDFPGPGFFAQASNFVDINNDGMLDAFICNDDAESFIYENDSNGFILANEWIDMSINGSSGEEASGNYGSVWTDFDNDGDLDLHIAKCRQGVSSQTDERRINKLFVNDGDNNFTEMAGEYGLRIGYQSWTGQFQDIDNDGDLDAFITNHDHENQLLENDGTGHFTEITAGAGLEYDGTAIQGMMRDFDNDGWMDIIVTGTTHTLYLNNGNKTFTVVENIFDDNQIESLALGDLNCDGFVDIYAGYAGIYTNPSNIPDVLWMNDGNSNNHISVHLTGTTSNRDGVGARIEIYGDWGVQVREVRAGESYGISNSVTSQFGLGQATEIDHMIIKWPSGIVDVIDNPTINQCMEVVEGACLPGDIDITYTGSTIICSGESFSMSAPDGVNYYWSNGENTQEISVSNSGNYSVVVENANGCFDLSQVLSLEVDPDETPTIEALGSTSFCEGGSVMLTASEASSYLWSNGMTEQTIEVSTSGNYSVEIQGLCSAFSSQEIAVTLIPTAALPVADDVEVLAGEDVTLTATGTNLTWYDAAVDGNLLETGPSYTITNVTAPATFYVENSEATSVKHGPEDHAGNSNYSGNEFNGEIIFDCMTEFKLKSVKVITDTEGTRMVELVDAGGQVVASISAEVPVGESRIDLGFIVEPGTDYKLTTNLASNLAEFGYESARFQRTSNGGINYPYVLDNVVSLNNSNFGPNRYYYFYDWDVQTPPSDCISDRVAVEVSLALAVVDINDTDAVNVFPNPGNGLFNIELDLKADDVKLMVSSIAGKQLLQNDLGAVSGKINEQLDLTKFAKGTYLLQVQTEGNTYFTKLVLQ